MQFLLYPIALLAGLMTTMQSGFNTTLNKALERPVLVGFLSSSGTFTCILLACLVSGQFRGGLAKAGQVPWWAWCNGVAGAVLLLSQPIVAPKIGAGTYVGLVVTVAVVSSVACDNYALLGFQHHAASVWRLLGAGLMVVGVGLVAAF